METIMEKNEQKHWAEDVYEYITFAALVPCDYCGSERTIPLAEKSCDDYSICEGSICKHFICESCATLSKEERMEVKRSIDKPIQSNKEDETVCDTCENKSPTCCNGCEDAMRPIDKNVEPRPCPDQRYEGSLWCYAEEGFRMHWNGRQWNLRCTKPCSDKGQSVFEDEDPVALELEGFWELIEYGGCTSMVVKPESRKHNPNKAPDINVPWDPYGD